MTEISLHKTYTRPDHIRAVYGRPRTAIEWHPRAPTERLFEEGDVVSIGPDGLTRDTRNASQVAVISRWAAVEASAPPEAERGAFDRVAYTGHVPVKLNGPCRCGDIIVPSGEGDGCAKAISSDDPIAATSARLGRALETIGQGSALEAAEDEEAVAAGYELRELSTTNAIAKVLISVTAPVASVPVGSSSPSPRSWRRLVLSIVVAITMMITIVQLVRTVSDTPTSSSGGDPAETNAHLSATLRAVSWPVCRSCHGSEGLYCERLGSEASKGSCQKCGRQAARDGYSGVGCLVSVDARVISCNAAGGSVCVPSAMSCSVCETPAMDSISRGCELSGSGPWGSRQPHLPASPRVGKDDIMPGYVQGWGSQKVLCLSDVLSTCLKPMVWNEPTSMSPTCRCHYLAECGSDEQAFCLANTIYRCGPSGTHSKTCPSGANSSWSWVARPCQVGSLLSVEELTRHHRAHSTIQSTVKGASWSIDRCAVQTLSAIAVGRCTHCGDKDTIFALPAARVGTSLAGVCPFDTHTGNISCVCGSTGWIAEAGACVRKTCPSDASVALSTQIYAFLTTGKWSPWPELSLDYRDWVDADRGTIYGSGEFSFKLPPFESHGATIFWPQSPEGTTITLPCPTNARHRFSGRGAERSCVANSTQWSQPRVQCKIQQCPAGPHVFAARSENGNETGYELLMPAASLGSTVELDCCSKFTKAGGCQDSTSSSECSLCALHTRCLQLTVVSCMTVMHSTQTRRGLSVLLGSR
eukprot:COSAG01_NODE_1365_length_10560_cov_38.008986_4_plen_755_part_00